MFCRTVLQMTAVMELVLLHDVTSAGGAHWERLLFLPCYVFMMFFSRRWNLDSNKADVTSAVCELADACDVP